MGRLGVRLETGPQYAPRDVVEMAGLAEEQGYETVWVPEGAGTDALTQLTAISGSTRACSHKAECVEDECK